MLKRDMLEVEMESNNENENDGCKVNGPQMLSKTPYLHCSEEKFSVRPLSASTNSDTSDWSRRTRTEKENHANVLPWLDTKICVSS
jgi:hypothetical protein